MKSLVKRAFSDSLLGRIIWVLMVAGYWNVYPGWNGDLLYDERRADVDNLLGG